jgi:hypothetical protein
VTSPLAQTSASPRRARNTSAVDASSTGDAPSTTAKEVRPLASAESRSSSPSSRTAARAAVTIDGPASTRPACSATTARSSTVPPPPPAESGTVIAAKPVPASPARPGAIGVPSSRVDRAAAGDADAVKNAAAASASARCSGLRSKFMSGLR